MKRALLFAALLAVSCKPPADKGASPTPAGEKPFRVGLVFDIGGRGDNSFNDAADRGLERAKKELGVEVEVLEPGDGADRESGLRQLAAKKMDVVFGVGFLFTEDITAIARDFPDVKLACVDYTVTPETKLPPNLVALKFKEEEGSFLVGALAAKLSKTGKVGFVGGMEIPLIKKFEAGYIAGVKQVDPKAQVIVKYAGLTGDAFKNPGKGKELALAIYSQGADVIYHASGSTGQGVFEAAKDQKKLAIGVDSDQWHLAPGVVVTSMVKRVEVAVFDTIKAAKEGRFEGGQVKIFDLESGGVDWVYDDRNKAMIPEEARAAVEDLRGKIIRNEIQVPDKP